MIDPLDIQLARHLDEIDASDVKNEWIDRRVTELLQGEYSPEHHDNMIEAIGNTSEANKLMFASQVNQRKSIGLASFINDISWEYWCKHAEYRAEQEWRRR